MGRENWETNPDGFFPPCRARHDRGDKARWETNWETSPARRTQHPSQGERQSQVGDKLGDRRQAQRGGHSTPAKADTLKTALRTPTVNCLGKNCGWFQQIRHWEQGFRCHQDDAPVFFPHFSIAAKGTSFADSGVWSRKLTFCLDIFRRSASNAFPSHGFEESY